MDNHTTDYSNDYQYENVIHIEDPAASRRFMANVFAWMFGGLALSAITAYLFAYTSLLFLLINPTTGMRTGLGTIVTFAPLAFTLVMSFGFNRLSKPVLALLFLLFAALMGASLGFIFLVYTAGSILGVFITASAVFGIMAVAGYTTQQDLTKFGAIMMIGLFGLVIATLLNMLFPSLQLNMVLTYIGVIVFTGLTAYDVQRIKRLGGSMDANLPAGKLAILGALTLYLDFVNLFLYLLRLFGRRR
ncbi:Bax inhibitor-1/YccA family protein [Mucilaginibacter koreensis]